MFRGHNERRFLSFGRFNWGLTLRRKSERILKLLEEGHHLKEERDRARKLSRGIQGFGSFSQRSNAAQEASSSMAFSRSHSDFINHESGGFNAEDEVKTEDFLDLGESEMIQKFDTSSKENMGLEKEELHLWILREESHDDPLINRSKDESIEDDHPFNSTERHANASLLSARDGILQGC